MQTTMPDHSPQTDRSQHRKNRFRGIAALPTWTRSPIFGYFASVFFIAALLALAKLDEYIPQAPLFVGAPFAIISILTALLWGIGPALLSLVLGVIAIAVFISPDVMALGALSDIALIGPFILFQLIAIATVIRLERSHRGLLVAHRELEVANQKLLQTIQLKDYVFTRAAHELRTPLTTILGRTQLLASRIAKSGESAENWESCQKYLEVVEVRARYLRTLIDSLVDLSRVQSSEVPLYRTPCDLTSLCRDVVEHQRVFSGRSIELEVPKQALLLSGDDKRLSQAIENVISNAVKYSSEDTTISVRVYSEDNQIIVQVHNEGTTLSPEEVEKLFEPFYRTSDKEYSPIQGWGLGLTISKAIVERHGGHIWVESSGEDGSTFFIKLPFHAEAD